jgi:hypothetical protein
MNCCRRPPEQIERLATGQCYPALISARFFQWEFPPQIQFQNPGNSTGCESSRTVRAMAARRSAD